MGNIVPPSLTTRLRLDPDATLRRGPCQSRSGFGGRPRGWRLFGSRLYRDGLQAQLLRGRQRPDLVSERAVTTDGFPDPSDLSRNHRRIDRLHPAVTPWRGPGIQADRGRNAGRRTVKTGPWPILGSLDQSRTKRIPLDVPQHHSEVVILLDGKGLEPALPDVSAGMVMPLVAPDMELDLLVPVLFSAHVGEHVEPNVSLATAADARLRRPVGLTAVRCTDVFAFEPGPASWKHAPTPERCPRQEPLGRNRPAAFTLCYKVSGPSALPRALSQWTRGKGMKMIENGQNKAGFPGVCRCQITTYDKESEVLRGH